MYSQAWVSFQNIKGDGRQQALHHPSTNGARPPHLVSMRLTPSHISASQPSENRSPPETACICVRWFVVGLRNPVQTLPEPQPPPCGKTPRPRWQSRVCFSSGLSCGGYELATSVGSKAGQHLPLVLRRVRKPGASGMGLAQQIPEAHRPDVLGQWECSLSRVEDRQVIQLQGFCRRAH